MLNEEDAYRLDQVLSDNIEMASVPLIIKHATLMSEGIWNNLYYDRKCIKNAFDKTDWKCREKSNLFLDHKDTLASEWIGEVKNLGFSGDTLYGDLVVYDPIWAAKLKHGKPKVGISPKLQGEVDEGNKVMQDFVFENFSLVINPAVKTAYINNMEALKVGEGDLDSEIEESLKCAKPEAPVEEPKKKKKYPYPEEMEDEIIAAAKEILTKRKACSEPKSTDAEDLEDLETLMENLELKKQNIATVIKKAKEIRKEGESWKAAMKRAAQMQEESEVTAKMEESKLEEKNKLEEQEKQIKILSDQIRTLTDKLNEPEKIEVKKVNTELIEDVDAGMIKYLLELDKEVK